MKPASRHTFWLGRVTFVAEEKTDVSVAQQQQDQQEAVVQEMIQSLQDDSVSHVPLFIDGSFWAERFDPTAFRRQAALSLLQALSDPNTTTQTLHFQKTSLDDDLRQALSQAFQNNTSLRCVKLRNLTAQQQGHEQQQQGENHYYELPPSLFQNNNLETLVLANQTLSRDSCRNLANMILESKSLTTLELDGVEITDSQGWGHLVASLVISKSLKNLKMNGVQLLENETDMKQQLLAALSKNESIKDLTMECMKLNASHASSLASFFRGNTTAQRVSLRRNEIDGQAIQAVLREGLVYNATCTNVLLSLNPLGEQGGHYIAEFLSLSPLFKATSRLEELCLAETQLGMAGSRAIVQGLRNNHCLRSISLDSNDFQHCGQDVLDSLQSNVSLHSIVDNMQRLLQKTTDQDVWKQVDLLLRANSAHRRVVFEKSYNNCSDRNSDNTAVLLPHVLAAASSQPDVLFHFLTETTAKHFSHMFLPMPRDPKSKKIDEMKHQLVQKHQLVKKHQQQQQQQQQLHSWCPPSA